MEVRDITKYIKEVRDNTQELTDSLISDDKIVDKLNMGKRDAVSFLSRVFDRILFKTQPVDLVANQKEYDFPKDCLAKKVSTVKYQYQGIFWRELDEKFSQDEAELICLYPNYPEFFIVLNDKIRLYPTPNLSKPQGLELIYVADIQEITRPFGKITKVYGSRIYVDSLNIYNDDDSIKLAVNDYISITDRQKRTVSYSYRVKSFDETAGYIEIASALTGLSLSSVNTSLRQFVFSGSPDFTNIVEGDSLVISGSVSNDGTYTIMAVDATNYTLYVREAIPANDVTGTLTINLPTTYDGLTISTSLLGVSINRNDYVAEFNKTSIFKLDEIIIDYIIQYATIEILREAKEPIEDAQGKLVRLAKEIEDYGQERLPTLKFKAYKG